MIDSLTLRELANFPEQLERFYSAIPVGYRNWVPDSWEGIPSESFSAIGQVCHVRDIELDGYHVRFQRMLREDTPTLESLDGYMLAEERRYSESDAAEALAAFRNGREETVRMFTELTEEQSGRMAYFDGYGRLTVRGLAHYLCSHDQQHLAGLQWLMGKIDAARV
jgi:hypothetical protein